jgi:ATP-dependent DNA helicase RecG
VRPEPAFEERQGFRVTFRKDIYNEEHLKMLGLNERQVKAIKYAKESGDISLSAYKSLATGTSEKTLYRDLQDLVQKGLFKSSGEKKGRTYRLK